MAKIDPGRKGIPLIVSCMRNNELTQIFYEIVQVKSGTLNESEGLKKLVDKHFRSFAKGLDTTPEIARTLCAESFQSAITYELACRFFNTQEERKHTLRVFLTANPESITVIAPANVDVDDTYEVYDWLETFISEPIDYWQIEATI